MRKTLTWKAYLGVALSAFLLTGLVLLSLIWWREWQRSNNPVGAAKAELEEVKALREQIDTQRQLAQIEQRPPDKKILLHAGSWSDWVPIYEDPANASRGWRYKLSEDVGGVVEVVYTDGGGDRFQGKRGPEDFNFPKPVKRIRWKTEKDTLALIWFTEKHE